MKFAGIKIGLLFLAISILLSLTIVGPLLFTMFAENIGSAINSVFHLNNVSGTTFYTCTVLVFICFVFYIYTFIKNNKSAIWVLVVLFVVVLIFFNAAIFYFKIRFPDSRIDGQQAFDAVAIPIKTSWLYAVIGLIHDIAADRHLQKKNQKN